MDASKYLPLYHNLHLLVASNGIRPRLRKKSKFLYVVKKNVVKASVLDVRVGWYRVSGGCSIQEVGAQFGQYEVETSRLSHREPEEGFLLDVDRMSIILEVDLEYPESLHDYHSDLQLAPESSVPPGCKEKRLLTILYPKTKYVVHIRNVKQYLKLGLVLKKVHKILEFHQESWLQPYIKMNIQIRTEAENEFEGKILRMNNAIFREIIETIRKRVGIRACSYGEKVERLTNI
ncbi:uncharacterized protein NPIL_608201 [Nephila pilipes]|uniref:Uncharacterized protein n=1 Tax=Nephila pilipes TaxID=299642 RepID=A0A8X6P8Z8_NEPPI|nr:uncharacterized protein NPIL_608201 [Nephila pilipes]